MKNYKKPDVANVQPGYKNQVWIAPLEYFTTLAQPAPAAVDDARFIIEDDHVFPVGKGFHIVTLTQHKNTATGESKGDAGASWLTWKGSIAIPGDSPKAQSLVSDLLNGDFIILMKDATCPGDTVYQYGCVCNPGSVTSAKMDGGTTSGDAGKGWVIEFETNCRDFYQGTIAESTT